MPCISSSAIVAAFADVDENSFVRDEHGDLVAQSTAGWAIAQMLDRLQVRPGMRLLEIGTGSGYSTALLAMLVGSAGQVVSMDVVPELVSRARRLLTKAGLHRVRVHCADGVAGAAGDAPFDRIGRRRPSFRRHGSSNLCRAGCSSRRWR
ncbi:MAG: protein-L-isoaspartate O-methyltransferase family protein [Pseudonocardiaceae bacterium]